MINYLDSNGLINPTFESLWEYSMIGLALVDQDGRFLYANNTFSEITEYSEAELQQRKWQDITDPRDLKPDQEMTDRIIRGETSSYTMRKRYITKTGKVKWIALLVAPVEKFGKFQFFLSQIALETGGQLVIPDKYQKAAMPSLGSLLSTKIKDFWAIILTFLGAIGMIVAEVIRQLKD